MLFAASLRKKSAVIKEARIPDDQKIRRLYRAQVRRVRKLKKAGLERRGALGALAGAIKLLVEEGTEVTPKAISDLVGAHVLSIERAAVGLEVLRADGHYDRIVREETEPRKQRLSATTLELAPRLGAQFPLGHGL